MLQIIYKNGKTRYISDVNICLDNENSKLRIVIPANNGYVLEETSFDDIISVIINDKVVFGKQSKGKKIEE